jgi:hypothetical protein
MGTSHCVDKSKFYLRFLACCNPWSPSIGQFPKLGQSKFLRGFKLWMAVTRGEKQSHFRCVTYDSQTMTVRGDHIKSAHLLYKKKIMYNNNLPSPSKNPRNKLDNTSLFWYEHGPLLPIEIVNTPGRKQSKYRKTECLIAKYIFKKRRSIKSCSLCSGLVVQYIVNLSLNLEYPGSFDGWLKEQ